MAMANGYVVIHQHSANTHVYEGRMLKSKMKWKNIGTAAVQCVQGHPGLNELWPGNSLHCLCHYIRNSRTFLPEFQKPTPLGPAALFPH